jgi:hypothetical protein
MHLVLPTAQKHRTSRKMLVSIQGTEVSGTFKRKKLKLYVSELQE